MVSDWNRFKRTTEIAIFPNSAVFLGVLSDGINSEWKPMMFSLHKQVHDICLDLLKTALAALEARARNVPKLFTIRRSKAREWFKSQYAVTNEQLLQQLNRDIENPYTANYYLNDTIQKKRNRAMISQINSFTPDKDGRVSYSSILAIVNNSQNQSIEAYAANELGLFIDAYVKVASKRVIDNIPNVIEQSAIQSIKSLDLFQFTDDELAVYCSQSNRVLYRKADLQAKLAMFIEAEMESALAC